VLDAAPPALEPDDVLVDIAGQVRSPTSACLRGAQREARCREAAPQLSAGRRLAVTLYAAAERAIRSG